MYGKLFEQIYDSSVSEHWQAMVTFQQLIVLANRDGVVDMTPEAISRRTNLPIAIIKAGIEELEKPDNRSRNPRAEGRRIERLDAHRDWGWQIVNHEFYRALASADEKREADRDRIARKRAAGDVSQLVASSRCESHPVADVAHTDTEATAEALRERHGPEAGPVAGSLEDILERVKAIYPKREGSQRWADAKKSIRARLIEGSTAEELIGGVTRYSAFCAAKKILSTDKVQQAATFFGTNRSYLESWTVNMKAAITFPHPDDEPRWKRLAMQLKLTAKTGETWAQFQRRIRAAVADMEDAA